eukprot:CAMPEP_0113300918 /NCGR_PEP_ID=MMETSP0010_2-20120614/2349_1 /TAXON_ID=216773 ORGANISM="Corethron hystrix, Strain 308" /NCGR_SAMPLE_ID=MMETSP0010_2 /ASSEMBLY_ACC=CAM_ASM_000155 /LENGTH=142 /DNA_ID=CAMNT_0000154425 /DNA_START=1036 /DNA_END=1464 /DNA_ORIENTATION=+ /assembly_acc=CAM_ASM_000155
MVGDKGGIAGLAPEQKMKVLQKKARWRGKTVLDLVDNSGVSSMAAALKTNDTKIQNMGPNYRELKETEIEREASPQGLFLALPGDATAADTTVHTAIGNVAIPIYPLEKLFRRNFTMLRGIKFRWRRNMEVKSAVLKEISNA